jgi:hypothetical protein
MELGTQDGTDGILRLSITSKKETWRQACPPKQRAGGEKWGQGEIRDDTLRLSITSKKETRGHGERWDEGRKGRDGISMPCALCPEYAHDMS